MIRLYAKAANSFNLPTVDFYEVVYGSGDPQMLRKIKVKIGIIKLRVMNFYLLGIKHTLT